jgi:uncharacterized membrane protein
MEYLLLIFVHVLFGIVWAGGAIMAGFFIIPSVLEAGPAGGMVMAGVTKRKLPVFLSISATLVLLTGVRLYMLRFNSQWLVTPEGLALTIGAILGLGAFILGLFVQKPAAEKLGALAAKVAASGAPPTGAEAAELKALRERLGRIAKITAWHLLVAAILMAGHRLLAMIQSS